MAAKAKSGGSWLTVLLILAAIAVWAYEETGKPRKPVKPLSPPAEISASPQGPADGKAVPASGKPPNQRPDNRKTVGGYEIHRGCRLVEAPNNDGDSFILALADGRQEEFRLYFVDTPESAFKSYRGGETNHDRIRQQANDMGGITPQQAVEIGVKAKTFTHALLAGQPFTIFTRWDSPFHDQRYHAFVEVKQSGKERWLHELLVEKGYVRIHTKGADLPDRTPSGKHKNHLKALEAAAKRASAGAWGL